MITHMTIVAIAKDFVRFAFFARSNARGL